MEIKYKNKYHRINTIKNWKYSGVVYEDFDELYYTYIRTLNCSHCNKEFNNTKDRCLDHDHSTGLFRAIVCRKCNIYDTYIRYPNGYDRKIYNEKNKERIYEKNKEHREANREKINERNKIYREKNKEKFIKYYEKNKEKITKKYDCECGGKYSHSHKTEHLKTIKHTAWYMEQVD